METVPEMLAPYLEHLEALPFVSAIRILEASPDMDRETDFLISLTTPEGKRSIPVELKRTHLTRELGERLVQVRKSLPDLMVFAPLVGRDLAQRFQKTGVNFVDLAGNCHVQIGDRYYAHVEGRRAEQSSISTRALRAPAYQVLFVLLARSDLLGATARAIALAAGVSPQTVLDTKRRLLELRMLVSPKKPSWAPRGWRAALDFFVDGFATTLAPSLVLGRFRARERTAAEQDAFFAERLGETTTWRWGGGAACQRLTGYYRGDSTVIYVEAAPKPAQLQLIADDDGRILIARQPCPVAFESPNDTTVHPLLVYADLLAERNDRATEAAGEIFDRYLSKLA